MRARVAEGSVDDALARASRARVAVFGDFALDAYWHLAPEQEEADELSVETGEPIWRVERQHFGLGGAGNVVANLHDLGVAEVSPVGLVGDDLFGRELRRLLAERGVPTEGMLEGGPGWATLCYAKPHRGGRELNRIDFGRFDALDGATVDALIAALDRTAARSDAVVLNQQIAGGVSPPPVIDRLGEVIASHRSCRFLVDSRHHAGRYRGAILKLNAHEALAMCGEVRDRRQPVPLDAARAAAERLARERGELLFVTMGRAGMLVADGEAVHEVPAVRVDGPLDPVGAGDTVVAVLAAVLGAGGTALEAARLAVLAAAVTVAKLGTTGTATPDEIQALARRARAEVEADRW